MGCLESTHVNDYASSLIDHAQDNGFQGVYSPILYSFRRSVGWYASKYAQVFICSCHMQLYDTWID